MCVVPDVPHMSASMAFDGTQWPNVWMEGQLTSTADHKGRVDIKEILITLTEVE